MRFGLNRLCFLLSIKPVLLVIIKTQTFENVSFGIYPNEKGRQEIPPLPTKEEGGGGKNGKIRFPPVFLVQGKSLKVKTELSSIKYGFKLSSMKK